MVTKKIAPHQRAVKLAGHRTSRVATTARYRHVDRTGTALADESRLAATQRDRGAQLTASISRMMSVVACRTSRHRN